MKRVIEKIEEVMNLDYETLIDGVNAMASEKECYWTGTYIEWLEVDGIEVEVCADLQWQEKEVKFTGSCSIITEYEPIEDSISISWKVNVIEAPGLSQDEIEKIEALSRYEPSIEEQKRKGGIAC